MTSDWKECTLEQISTILGDGLHGTPKYSINGKYAFINGNNLSNGKIIIKSDTKRVDKCEYEKYKKDLNNRTLLVSINGTLGNIAEYNEEKIILGKSACYFNVKEDIDKYFIKYILLSKTFQDYLNNQATGTTIKNISLKQMREYNFLLPPLETQQKIAKVLSAIDDKIELNNSINNNLEQQIKYLYNDYFCNCNEEIKITELIDVRDGTHDSPKSTEQGKHLITSKHLKKYGVDKSTANIISEFDYAKINERSIVCTNDILISMIGTVGIVSLIIENPVDFAVKNVGIFKTSNFIEYTYYIHCFLNSNNTQNYIKSHLAGTTQKYISLGELRNLIINKPDESQLNKFNLIVHLLYQQIILNVKENVRLTQLRETLLPKLMSGEIDVSNVNISADKLLFNEEDNNDKL